MQRPPFARALSHFAHPTAALGAALFVLISGCATSHGGRSPQTVLVATDPAGAELYFDDTLQCTAPCQLALSRAPAKALLVLKKPGFLPRSVPVAALATGAAGPALAGALGAMLSERAQPTVANFVPSLCFSLQPLAAVGESEEGKTPAWVRPGGAPTRAGSWQDAAPRRP